MRRLEEKIAVITGAGRGIGAAIARAFAAEGAAVQCLDVDPAAAGAVASELNDAGGRALARACDVRDSESVRAGVEATVAAFGRLDVVVANAATETPRVTVDALSLEDWRDALDVNLTGAFLLCRHALPVLRTQGTGSIILLASQHGSGRRPGTGCLLRDQGGLGAAGEGHGA